MRRASCLAISFAACGGPPDPATSEPAACEPVRWFQDADGDGLGGDISQGACEAPEGFVPATGDCDDADPAVTTPRVFYADRDRDGLGDAEAPVEACHPPEGTVEQPGDCEDGIPSVGGQVPWYQDSDGDGFGGEGSTLACDAPEGFVSEPTDCDDGDPFVYPGAPPICGDGVDNDCDAEAEPESGCRYEGEHVLTGTRHAWYGLTDVDGLGTAMSSSDLDGDGIDELIMSAPGSGWDGSSGGTNGYVAVLPATAGSGAAEEVAPTLYGWTGEGLGIGLGTPGDLDGDGSGDLMLADARQAWLVTGISAGHHVVDDVAVARFGFQSGARAIAGLAHQGPDGAGVIAMLGEDASFAWSVVLFEASVSGDAGIDDAWARIVDRSVPDAIGHTVTNLGDVDGDGRDDLGMSDADAPYDGIGSVFVLTEIPTGTSVAADIAHVVYNGGYDGAGAGCSLPRAGDTDGDGYEDLLIGSFAYFDPMDGGAYPIAASLVLGPSGSGEQYLPDVAAARWSTSDLGSSTATAGGDLDGDGFTDVALDASRVDNSYGYHSGGAFLFYGPMSGALDLEADADARFFDETWSHAGDAMTFVPDVDGDGTDELLIGAPAWGPPGESYYGAVYLALGGEVF
jgi:hypothetical protein